MSRPLPEHLRRHLDYLVRQSVKRSDQLQDTLAHVAAHMPPICVSPTMIRRALLYATKSHHQRTKLRWGAIARQKQLARQARINAIVAESVAAGHDLATTLRHVRDALGLGLTGNSTNAALIYALTAAEAQQRRLKPLATLPMH